MLPTVDGVTGAVPEPLPDWLTEARRIVVLTGAGISTESGIPDYRGPNGVWTKDPDAEKLVTLSYYVNDPDIRRRAWQMRRNLQVGDIVPNAGHRALADLERQGRLRALLTQNIDGLHQQAGSSPAVVLELHGTIHEVANALADNLPAPKAPSRKARRRKRKKRTGDAQGQQPQQQQQLAAIGDAATNGAAPADGEPRPKPRRRRRRRPASSGENGSSGAESVTPS